MTEHRPTPTPRLRGDRTLLGSILLALGVFAAGCGLLLHEREKAAAEVRAEVEVTAEQVAARLSLWISDRVGVLEQFAALRGRPDVDDEDFRTQARAYVERVPGFLAINWIDSTGHLRLVEPGAPNRAALGRDLTENPDPAVRTAIVRSLETLLPSRTDYISFYQGGRGFSIYWPVAQPGERFGSVVNGVITLDAIIVNALPEVQFNARYLITLEEGGDERIFTTGDVDGPGRDYRVTSTVDFVDRPLTLRVQPRSAPATVLLGPAFVVIVLVVAGLAVVLATLLHGYLQRQQFVRRQEAYIRLLMDSTTEGLVGVDLDGVGTFCNAASVDLLGGAPDGFIGADALSWLRPRDPEGPSPARALLRAVAAGEPWGPEVVTAVDGSGRQFPAECRANPVSEDGTVNGALVTFTDVTAEHAGTERAQRLTAVLHQVPELVALTTPVGDFTFLNPAGLRMLGLEDEDPAAFNIFAFLDARTVTRVSEIVGTVMAEGLWRGQVGLVSWDGRSMPAEAVLMHHRDLYGTDYFSGVVRDLSERVEAERERRSLEEQFREAQRMESLGLLAGGIAHDFNNMLVGVLGNASLALEHLPEDAPAHAHVRQVQTATEHAAALVGQLLAYSGRGRFEAEPTDLAALVRDMATLLRTSIPRSVALEVDCEDSATVVADATQLRQLVMNLIRNAADAIDSIDGRGRVRVRVSAGRCDPAVEKDFVWERPEAACDAVLLEVEDDGAGMPPGVLTHIFDPFFTTKATGKGLGLAAVRGIVNGHDAHLALRSTPGEGTRFRIYFPPTAEPLAAAPAPVRARSAGVSGAILLVDDEPSVRRFLETALKSMGFEVIAREDGESGIEAFREHHRELALVIMDQTMPGLSGDAAWERMHAIDPSVPGLLISGYDEVRIEGSLRDKGLSGFLQKPFKFQELKAAIVAATAPAEDRASTG